VCSPTPLQIGAAAGVMALGDEYFEDLSAKYRRKRELICTALDEVGLTPCIPEGAYYVLADISMLPGKDSKERCMYLLGQTGVGSVPGQSFFASSQGENIARFCFAKEDDVIEEACRRLQVVKTLKTQAATA
jgi:aminotransferase